MKPVLVIALGLAILCVAFGVQAVHAYTGPSASSWAKATDAGFYTYSGPVYRSTNKILFATSSRELMFIRAEPDGGSALCFPGGDCVSGFADGGTDKLHAWLDHVFDVCRAACPDTRPR